MPNEPTYAGHTAAELREKRRWAPTDGVMCRDAYDGEHMESGTDFYQAVYAALPAILDENARLRASLEGLIGVSEPDELRAMEAVMRLAPIPAADKAAMIDAIHVLLGEAPDGQ